jgi:5-methylcytosine-specific restriction protein A
MPSHGADSAVDRERQRWAKARVEWRTWYKSPTWKAIKRHRLAEEPYCRCCAQEGRAMAATHVDHVEDHLGQWALFTKYQNTQSLCDRHHASRKRTQ